MSWALPTPSHRRKMRKFSAACEFFFTIVRAFCESEFSLNVTVLDRPQKVQRSFGFAIRYSSDGQLKSVTSPVHQALFCLSTNRVHYELRVFSSSSRLEDYAQHPFRTQSFGFRCVLWASFWLADRTYLRAHARLARLKNRFCFCFRSQAWTTNSACTLYRVTPQKCASPKPEYKPKPIPHQHKNYDTKGQGIDSIVPKISSLYQKYFLI